MPPQDIAVIGGGWAGCAAAVTLAAQGQRVSLFEAAPMLGGRARSFSRAELPLQDAAPLALDNGQHIAIGAYRDTLALLQQVGIDTQAAFLRMPFTLRQPDGAGLTFARLPAPVNALTGIALAKAWSLRDKWALLRWAAYWQFKQFTCPARTTLAEITQHLPVTVQAQFIAPLCLSALNTPVPAASAAVFLRVLRDAMFLFPQGSDFLLPRQDLGALFPQQAAQFLQARGGTVTLNARINALARADDGTWLVDGARFERVIVATPCKVALELAGPWLPAAMQQAMADMRYEAIATVYALAPGPLPAPMLMLRDSAAQPAQFVFDRTQLLGPSQAPAGQNLLAFVVSCCTLPGAALAAAVVQQAQEQLGLRLTVLETIVEKRATFACTPAQLAARAHWQAQPVPGLALCGDYLHPHYPATLEGAVQSALAVCHAP